MHLRSARELIALLRLLARAVAEAALDYPWTAPASQRLEQLDVEDGR